MEFGLRAEGPEWYTVYAWAFLEDVYRLRTAAVGGETRAWHCSRYLGACATNLRSACEAQFGRGDQLPDEDVMWFITKARHASAHGAAGGLMLDPNSIRVKWNDKERNGWVEATTTLIMRFDTSAEPDGAYARAQAYLESHGGKLFPALHAATRTVAEWTGTTLDSDFESIGHEDHAACTIRLPLRSMQQRDRFIQASRGYGAFEVDLGQLDRQSWSIHSSWQNAEPGAS